MSAAGGIFRAIESGTKHLIYTPDQLAVKPKYGGNVEIKIDGQGATHG